jgi:hypothetical protein
MGGAYMAGFAMYASADRIHHKQRDVCATPGGTNVTLLNSFWLVEAVETAAKSTSAIKPPR